jgi:hypothetical protein
MAQAPIPSRPEPGKDASRPAGKQAEKPIPPLGAPTLQRAGRHLVAVGTVVHQDKDGKRTTIQHGQPLPDDMDSKDLKHLEARGAAARIAPQARQPGVEAKKAPEWTWDADRGVWVDEQGSIHKNGDPPPAAEDDE